MDECIEKRFGKEALDKLRKKTIDLVLLEDIKKFNNPENKQIGHYTGRCMYCHSDDLWSDAVAYGCNLCDSMYFTSNLPPKIVKNND